LFQKARQLTTQLWLALAILEVRINFYDIREESFIFYGEFPILLHNGAFIIFGVVLLSLKVKEYRSGKNRKIFDSKLLGGLFGLLIGITIASMSISEKLKLEQALSSGEALTVEGIISDYKVVRRETGQVNFNVGNISFKTGESYGYYESKYVHRSLKNGYKVSISYFPESKVILKINLFDKG